MGPLGGAGLCGDSIGSVLSSTLSLSPHGRFHTMSIMIAVDILGCTGSTEERAALLHKTIQLAAELKSTMGNMFSFAAVMNALEMTQVRGRSLPPGGSALGDNGDNAPAEAAGWKQGRDGAAPSEQTAQPRRDAIVFFGGWAFLFLCWALFLRGNESALRYNTNQSQGRGSSVSRPRCSLWKMKGD